MTTQPTDTERLSRLEGAYEHLATKADLAETKAELKADILATKADLAETKAELKADILATKADLAETKAELKADILATKADIAEMESRLIKWTVGAIIGVSAIVVAIVRLLG